MLTDANKGITGIIYNHLNLPGTVTLVGTNKKIDYFYDAVGTKLKKVVTDASSLITTEYAGNFVYESGVLQFFNTAEGYVEPNGTGWQYVYQYKDHLGNVRLSYADSNGDGIISPSSGGGQGEAEIREENNFYPFGLKHKGYNFVVNGRDHKYGFGNKEEQDELGLGWIDITARNYDPALGRWMNLDPLAEAMRRHSPYNYAFDNPNYFIDYDGMMPKGSIHRELEGEMFDFSIEDKNSEQSDKLFIEDQQKISDEVNKGFQNLLTQQSSCPDCPQPNSTSEGSEYTSGNGTTYVLVNGIWIPKANVKFINVKIDVDSSINNVLTFGTLIASLDGSSPLADQAALLEITLGVTIILAADNLIEFVNRKAGTINSMIDEFAKDSSKDERHGDSRALEKVGKQIAELEDQLANATGNAAKQIKQKIQNIKRNAAKNKKGETHSRNAKGN